MNDPSRLGSRQSARLQVWNELVRRLGPDLPTGEIWADAFTPDLRPAPKLWMAITWRNSQALYRRHRPFLDGWLRRGQVAAIPPYHRKLCWRARQGPYDLERLIVQFRRSGIVAYPPVVLPTLTTECPPVIGWQGRTLTPREAARLQGFPDDHPLPATASTAHRLIGNAVHPDVVRQVARALIGTARPVELDDQATREAA